MEELNSPSQNQNQKENLSQKELALQEENLKLKKLNRALKNKIKQFEKSSLEAFNIVSSEITHFENKEGSQIFQQNSSNSSFKEKDYPYLIDEFQKDLQNIFNLVNQQQSSSAKSLVEKLEEIKEQFPAVLKNTDLVNLNTKKLREVILQLTYIYSLLTENKKDSFFRSDI